MELIIIRKLDILQEGNKSMKMDYAYITGTSYEFEGVIDTLNIVGKKVRFQY